ncbi:uncharacterized protein LOC117574282 [Drosophila albomicans]|uniref:Uncharacterized protein LOC117574282 n=1 Tax=Drosophila albomicans TaxID=7291 RepID=A0A6P8XLU1_DROAB|nr:uncharacterized protein LOC117574282 [Drosophila albomicans]
MRLKEYPTIILDTIPKLYERQINVFITHLYGIEAQVERLPKKFCKMYTTQPLANQLLEYLGSRGANISSEDFHIVPEGKPFSIRLSDGKRLEIMLCAGNVLANSLMLLIRRLRGGRLLYYYSAVQQDDLNYLMGNTTFQEWIALGTEELLLNLQAAHQPFDHIDFEQIAEQISKFFKENDKVPVIEVPQFGYELLIRKLAETSALFGHIKLLDSFQNSYRCLTSDLRYFHRSGYTISLAVNHKSSINIHNSEISYPLSKLKWSPVPNRINLIQICSLLRPLHISGIVGYHEKGNVTPVPEFLKNFKCSNAIVSKTQVIQESVESKLCPTKRRRDYENEPILFTKSKKLAYVDDDDDIN